jgi:CDP-diacylglycerol--glycerol-3-phosphate 3-phosphatidyltransferase
MPLSEPLLTVPNLLSLLRIVLAIPIALLLTREDFDHSLTVKGIFILLAFLVVLSDFLDGYFARKLDCQTSLGKVVDAVSDKAAAIAVITVLILFRNFPLWIALALLAREAVIVVSNYIAIRCSGRVESSNIPGRWFITFLAVAIFCYILGFPLFFWILMLPTAYFAVHSTILYILLPIKAKPEVTNAHHLSR